ncbi:hypothetical protein H6F67_15445 [Microcoleus sp. FACHB-1515]|uniref:hypothetical protein n=1 Tax=Cyanophyceae TaxID=3028117 RepID=UPI0016870CDA|nr:hypothetical protein [Microcoleus sp. FACHB-1515]MBD2091249.1 hypothetical protein [Microcoleus sp. FACHB-1515]
MAREQKRSIRWDDDVYQALERAAAETGSTITAIANEAVRTYLLGKQQLTMTNLDQRLRRVELHLGFSSEEEGEISE